LANANLLAKWRWRLLDDEPLLWKDVLKDKYGPLVSFSSGVVGGRCHLMLHGGGGMSCRWRKKEGLGG
jgi:hypothetical protein